MSALALANPVRSREAGDRLPVVQVRYGFRGGMQSFYGATLDQALQTICRRLEVLPEDLRAAAMPAPSQYLVLGERRGEVVWPAAFVVAGVDAAALNAGLDALARSGWAP